jgi:hypothetical protein
MKNPVFALSFKPHPFRFLLRLEWVLLGLSTFKLLSLQFVGMPIRGQTTSLSEFGLPESDPFQPIQVLGFLGLLIIFTCLGFRLPTDRLSKFSYMSFSFLVIGTLGYLNAESLPPLLIILLLRGCLIFERRGRWMIASLVWLSYMLTTLLGLFLVWVTLQSNTIKSWLSMIPGLIVRG